MTDKNYLLFILIAHYCKLFILTPNMTLFLHCLGNSSLREIGNTK